MKRVLITLIMASQVASAELSFDATLQEVEAAPSAKQVGAEFSFTNKTGQVVSISSFKPDCSCIAAEVKDGKLDYKPGESGVIRTVFDIGNSIGTVDQVLAVWLTGDPKDKPSINLTVRIKIPELVVIEPKSLKWQHGGNPQAQRIRVTMHHDDPIHIHKVSSSSKDFMVTLETIEAGRQYDLIVQPKNINIPGITVITIDTDCAIKKQQKHQAYAMVLKE